MNVIKISPRGYCYGVVDAMVIAKNAALDKNLPRPIYILGMIVHNKHVTDAFEEDGIYTLDGPNRLDILKQVESGTVIFTAHGVSPEVRQIAEEKALSPLMRPVQMSRKHMNSFQKKQLMDMTLFISGKRVTLSQKEPSVLHLTKCTLSKQKLILKRSI